jgi:hypothetical protein
MEPAAIDVSMWTRREGLSVEGLMTPLLLPPHPANDSYR